MSHSPPPSHPLTSSDTPSQRVQFILGTEEDAEHVAHELFTELDEICVKDGKDAEWKETARSVFPRGAAGNIAWQHYSFMLIKMPNPSFTFHTE